MISICMIVKDEEEIIEKSLESIKDLGYEIIIVDTGSKDKTVEISKKYTEKVYIYNWENDFSKARNYSISKASNEFVLILDADEVIKNIDKSKLEALLDENLVGRVLRYNKYFRNNLQCTYKERVNRLFSKNRFKYEGRIHEQIIGDDKYKTINIPIELEHIGYENSEINRKDKIKRNIELLYNELLQHGEDPYILFQLGKSYYMKQNFKKACEYFYRAMEFDLDTKLEYVIDMVESYGYALINSKRYNDALMLTNIYEEFKSSADFIFLIGLIYMNNGMFDEAIKEFKNVINYKDSKMKGVNSYLAYYNIAAIYECLGKKDLAISYYEKGLPYELCKERINLLKGIYSKYI